MRLNFTLSASVLGLALIGASCSKTSQQEMVLRPASQSMQEISASVSSDAFYEMPVTSENVKIHRQASHFEVSGISVDTKTGVLKYIYSPVKGFTGSDEVTLSETKTYASVSNGGCNNGDDGYQQTSTTFVKIKFTVK